MSSGTKRLLFAQNFVIKNFSTSLDVFTLRWARIDTIISCLVQLCMDNYTYNYLIEYTKYIKPNYLKKQNSYLPKVQNGNGVPNRLVSCLKCMELAC